MKTPATIRLACLVLTTAATAVALPARGAEVIAEVSGARSSAGLIGCALFAGDRGFPMDNSGVLVSSPGPTATRFGETAGMRLGKAMQAQAVAHDTLEALGRSCTVLPGALTKLLLGAMLALPRGARVRIWVAR